MNYPKSTTYKEVWLLIAFMALLASVHEYDYQDSQQRLMNHYWYGE